MTWPGPKPGTGARIQVRGAGGLDEEIRRDGPWGLFRLFEAATSTAEKDKDKVFTVTWEMTAPPVTRHDGGAADAREQPVPGELLPRDELPRRASATSSARAGASGRAPLAPPPRRPFRVS